MSKKPADSSRALKVRVKTAGKRSLSSKLWLERQLNDPYVARAKREGFRSRATFKLMEIDDKTHFLRKGARVVDLGAAPGGWSQLAAKRVGAPDHGKVVGIDILDMDPIPGVIFAKLDFLDPSAPDKLKEMMGGPADVVLSAHQLASDGADAPQLFDGNDVFVRRDLEDGVGGGVEDPISRPLLLGT